MLSERTYKWDLDMENGKGYSYAASGVREYLMLDPTSRYLPERLRAWRLTDGSYQPWQPDKQGRWHSQELALAFALEGPFAAVYARGERRMLREGEVEAERARAREALERANAEQERIRAELAQRDEQLARQAEELERLRRLLEDQERAK